MIKRNVYSVRHQLLGFRVLVFILGWVILSQPGSTAQNITITTGIQKISSGALWYEYRKLKKSSAPTIVFEAGALSNANYWNPVIDSISNFSNTIRYDRAGLARSAPSTDSIRSSSHIAHELNELLDSLEIIDQIIMVCHSIGGHHGRTFAHLFRDRVRAIVLIESPCDQWEDLLRSSLTNRQNEERDTLLKQNRMALSFFERQEYAAAEINRKMLRQIPQMSMPVYILYGNNHTWPEDYDRAVLAGQWKECQNSLSAISVMSQLIMIDHAGHHVFDDFDLPSFLKETFIY